MAMKWKTLKNKPVEEFRRITGVELATFKFLLKLLQPAWTKRRSTGGPAPKLKLEDQLLLTLSYLRNYGTYLETGAKYGVSEARAWFISRWVETVLIEQKTLHLPGKKDLLAGRDKYEIVVFDVTECPIERPKRKPKARIKNKQRRYYSGKKKRHTVKEQVAVDQKSGKIIATNMDVGKTHDFKIYKQSKNRVHPDTKIQGDSGYQGIQKIHSNSELPKKRSKKNPLTKEDKARNREISSQRVIVENVFAFIKKFKILSQRYRNRRTRFGLRFNLVCAIFNYEWNG
jgi:hypothetical protein